MSTTRIFAIALLMLTVPLIGCIGGEDTGSTDDGPNGDDAIRSTLGQEGVFYKPGDTPNATDFVSKDQAFPSDVDTPVGLPRVVPHGVFEPTIGVTSSGNLFVSNLEGMAVTDYSSILRSTDQGQTWEDVTGDIGGLISSPPQSNDPYVYVDEDTDRVYNLDMQGLQCNYIRWSDDEGETWTPNPVGCGQPPVLDHPTLFSGPPRTLTTANYENVVYLCVNRVGDSACATSLDGGMTWAGFNTVYPGVNTEGELCGGLHAHGTTGPDGRAYLPKGQCGTPMVAISEDDGLTWTTVTISDNVSAPDHEVAFAVDEAGNAYAFWLSDDLPYLAVSPDNGFTWNEPIQVAPKGVNTAGFPTVAAGDDGRVAVAYIGTNDTRDYSEMGNLTTWNAYMTMAVNATSDDPVLTTVTVNDPEDPIARGNCNSGNRCSGDSGGYLGDFIDIVIDDDGRPWSVFVDACTEECIDDPSEGRDVGVGLVGTLQQGPTLRGDLASLEPLSNTTSS